MIRCACTARAGYDDIIYIKPQIQLSPDSFRSVPEVDSILDIAVLEKANQAKAIQAVLPNISIIMITVKTNIPAINEKLGGLWKTIPETRF